MNNPPSSSLFPLDCLERYFTFYFFFGFFFKKKYKQPSSNVRITKTYIIFVTTHHVASYSKLWVMIWIHYFFFTTCYVLNYGKSCLSFYDAAFFQLCFLFFWACSGPTPISKSPNYWWMQEVYDKMSKVPQYNKSNHRHKKPLVLAQPITIKSQLIYIRLNIYCHWTLKLTWAESNTPNFLWN